MKLGNPSTLFALIAGPLALLAACPRQDTLAANDRQIEIAAKSSYNFGTILENRVIVKATDGSVTLTGTVHDQEEKDLAADTVENLPGVLSVNNELKINPIYPEHSDAWMAFKIRCRLLVKAHVSAIHTKVTVIDGNVILNGTAGNLAQKELTEAYARDIVGVRTVKNDITVAENDITMMDQSAADTASETVDDASVTTQVRFALLGHQSTSALQTKVTTTAGVVHVSGVADSAAEKSLVTKLAADVRGAKSVTNDMTVKNKSL